MVAASVEMDRVNMAVPMVDITTRHPHVLAVDDFPVARNPVIVTRVVEHLDVMVTMMDVMSMMAVMAVMSMMAVVSMMTVMAGVPVMATLEAEVDLEAAGVRGRRIERDQTEESHTGDCKAFHDFHPILAEVDFSVRQVLPVVGSRRWHVACRDSE